MLYARKVFLYSSSFIAHLDPKVLSVQRAPRLLYITGVRGVGKSTIVLALAKELWKRWLSAAVFPEWSGFPRPDISPEEFAAWITRERLWRDERVRLAQGVDVILCDRSMICVLAFIEANRGAGQFGVAEAALRSHKFLAGEHIHLVAAPGTVLSRHINRSRVSAEYAPTSLDLITQSERAYDRVYSESSIPRHIVSTEDHTTEEIANTIINLLDIMVSHQPED